MSPVYEGTASLLVGDFSNGDVNNTEIQAMQSLTATYADIARREPVLSGAARDVGMTGGWRALDRSVTVRVPKESPQVIEIAVDGSSRERVIEIAGAVANRLVRYVDGMSAGSDFVSPQLRRLEQTIEKADTHLDELRARQQAEGADAPSSLETEINRTQDDIAEWQGNYASLMELASTSSHAAIRPLDSANAARSPVRPNIRFNTLIAELAGFLLALAIVYLLDSRRRPDDETGKHVAESPLLVPPTPSQVTIPINGRSIGRTRTPGRAEHPEGEVR
jgi:capsular polysaccharide biosynthesis protein